jgi:predicted ArsR family transcriptional regulator
VPGDSRTRILEFLKRTSTASVADMSRGLGLTPVTIRHHLEAMRDGGLVEAPSPRRKPGPGRPEMAYRLTSKADRLLPRNYGELCACLLSSLEGSQGVVGQALEIAGASLGATAELAGGTREGRMKSALAFLGSRGYFPSWERRGGSAALVLSNCPYLEVARRQPGVCRFDLALLERLLDSPVHLETSIARHDPCCRLRVGDGAAL